MDLVPMTPTIGAEVHGLSLAGSLEEKERDFILDGLRDWKVLFFRDQDINREQHVAFACNFGELEVHPFAPAGDGIPEIMVLDHDDKPRAAGTPRENIWHSDVSWREVPSLASVLRAVVVPDLGGDTLWADMGAAYDGLAPGMQRYLDGLTAVHDFAPSFGSRLGPDQFAAMRKQYPLVEHPVVRIHPVTGRRILYVNGAFTTRILGIPSDESKWLLDFLCRQAATPEYQCRFHWQPGSIAMWDNRCTQHYAVQDYWPQRRLMERVTIIGERPAGIAA
jgi:taurine dioxygenase